MTSDASATIIFWSLAALEDVDMEAVLTYSQGDLKTTGLVAFKTLGHVALNTPGLSLPQNVVVLLAFQQQVAEGRPGALR